MFTTGKKLEWFKIGRPSDLKFNFLFLNFFLRTSVLFVWPLVRMSRFLVMSGDDFETQGGSPCLCVSWCVCNEFLRFTPGGALADLLEARRMTQQVFDPSTCTRFQVEVLKNEVIKLYVELLQSPMLSLSGLF